MTDIFNGIRVVELAAWTLVPATGTLLAVRGADVIKVERQETRDPQPGLNGRQFASAGRPVKSVVL
jgi:crotonobetainyl-CoA:carnitine CoA-transferase CaiB-like acyl-CoA transferase